MEILGPYGLAETFNKGSLLVLETQSGAIFDYLIIFFITALVSTYAIQTDFFCDVLVISINFSIVYLCFFLLYIDDWVVHNKPRFNDFEFLKSFLKKELW